MSIEIVGFKNGKFGIRRTIHRLFRKPRYEFLRKDWWYWADQDSKNEHIYFNSIDEA